MMQAKSYSKSNGPAVTRGYMLHNIKNSWSVALLIFISMLLIATVPLMIEVGELNRYDSLGNLKDIESLHSRVANDLELAYGTMIVISCISAVVAGCYSLMFLHNKVSAGFFHSLPEKRSGHYITALVSSLTVYIFPLLINIAVMFLSLGAYRLLDGYSAVYLLKILLLSLFYYLVVLSITFFAGFLTGSSAMQAIFTLYILFVLPVIYYSVLIWLTEGLSYLQLDIFGELSSISLLTPIARIITVSTILEDPISAKIIAYLIMDAVLTSVFFIGAYFIYKSRPVERAGTPIIYKKLGEAVKYTVVFASSLLLAKLFEQIGGSVWLFFGLIAGAVISFMLCNTVLSRNAKAMFSGIKGFAVVCVVIIIAFVTTGTGVFGTLDYIVPNSSSVSVQLGGKTFEISDRDDIEEFRNIMKDISSKLKSGEIKTNRSIVFEKYYTYYDHVDDVIDKDLLATAEGSVRTASMYVDYHTSLGIDMKYNYYRLPYDSLKDIISILENSEDFKEYEMFEMDDNFELDSVMFDFTCPPYAKYISDTYGEVIIDEDFIAGDVYVDDVYAKTFSMPNIMIQLSELKSKDYTELYREFNEFLKDTYTKDHTGIIVGYLSCDGYVKRETEDGVKINYKAVDYTSYNSTEIPLYSDDIETVYEMFAPYFNYSYASVGADIEITTTSPEEIGRMIDIISSYTTDDYVSCTADMVKYILVADHENDTVKMIDDKEQMKEILNCTTKITNSCSFSIFTRTDSNYTLLIVFDENNYITSYFPEGNVPSFLK